MTNETKKYYALKREEERRRERRLNKFTDICERLITILMTVAITLMVVIYMPKEKKHTTAELPAETQVEETTEVPETEPETEHETVDVHDIIREAFPRVMEQQAAPIIEQPTEPSAESIDLYIGQNDFEYDGHQFHRYELPSFYYGNIDFSTMKAYMPYKAVTNKNTQAYDVARADCTYIDDLGLLRYPQSEEDYVVDGMDDYVVAMGTYYKPKGVCGTRYLIVTDQGNFTVITGDEKSNKDTDKYNMVSNHDNGYCILEFLVNTKALHKDIKETGTVSSAPVGHLQGKILNIYGID